MKENYNSRRSFIYKLIYAFVAQGVSLLMSVAMSLIVPKFLGVREYAYWQLYLFYISYVGFFHFGLNDGIYLKLGGKNYQDLDFPSLHSQMIGLLISQIIVSVLCFAGSYFVVVEPERRGVLAATGIYLVLFNIAGYLGFIFQAVNKTQIYSSSMLIDKLSFLCTIFVLIFVRTDSFFPFICFHLFCKALSLLYIAVKGKDVLIARGISAKETIQQMISNCSVGIKLTIANIASLLILGSGRMVIDAVWGVEAFGKLSFSLSLTNFFLLFVGQVSMVLFPALKLVDFDRLKNLYVVVRDGLSLFLPIILLGYYPAKFLLSIWLPAYKESLNYLGILLPLCTFDAKMQMLCNTYFKVLRKEKMLLYINLLSMFASILLALLGGFVVKSITFIAVSMVIAIAIRSVVAELYLAGHMDSSVGMQIAQESLLAIVFMVVSWNLSLEVAVLIYVAAYALFLILNRTKIRKVKNYILNRDN